MTPKHQEIDLLLRFVELCANGAVRPYDHARFIDNLRSEPDIQKALSECCPPSSEIRDAKIFKPYIQPALNKLSELFELDRLTKHNNR